MGLYIQIHSMHGLIRPQKPEIGRDVDTGGQVVYVLELAKALARLKKVERVDLVTRRIRDSNYPGYSKPVEPISDKAFIVRLECGPPGYIKKVDLWPHIGEYAENTRKYIRKLRRKPDILHGNYADAGLVCSKLSEELAIPFVHTGHSLGLPKMRSLGVNRANRQEFEEVFHFEKRLAAEQKIIDTASAIVASTKEEFKNQYKGYKIGKNISKFRFIPPGINLGRFYPPKKRGLSGEEQKTMRFFQNLLDQDLKSPAKPFITALSRLNKVKNINGLMQAYSSDRQLQSMANLVIFAQIQDTGTYGQKLIKKLNSMIRKHNLYGKVSMPAISLDYDKQVPEYYRFAAQRRSVFVNPALMEPFGLTVLEASACGLPVVATKNGGPSEIIADGRTGLLIDPRDTRDIARKLKLLLGSRVLWNEISENSQRNIRRNFSWDLCAKNYLRVFGSAIGQTRQAK
ncbi:MAG: glycosyltransferase [Candidatus Diapherotrites archaeon]|uniref:sucrose-phosphate synthase n=1 Tax=Candidatus Iainarchaeum sp. TaxID=3101447 RepID=A0A8T3YPF9_9ARCH|nr:glycosyltransferase [Candidatus Diapherotrites archaeon]